MDASVKHWPSLKKDIQVPLWSPTRLLIEGIRTHWVLYTIGTVALIATSINETLLPKFVQWALDTLSVAASDQTGTPKLNPGIVPQFLEGPTPKASLMNIVAAMLGLNIFGWFGRVIWRQTLARRSHQAGRDMRRDMWDVLRFEPLSTFHKYSLGDLMNRSTGDLNAGRSLHGFTVVLTYDMIFVATLSLIAMTQISPSLTAAVIAVFLVIPPLLVRLARLEARQHTAAQESLSQLSDLVTQCLQGIRMQRATASDGLWQKQLERKSREYSKLRLQVLTTTLKMFPIGAIPTLIAYGVLIIFGIPKIRSGEITIGGFVAMQSYVLMLQIPLFELGDAISEWQRGFASLKRIAEILNLKFLSLRRNPRSTLESTPEKDLVEASKPSLAIAISNFSFSYEPLRDHSRQVLKNISLSLSHGERIGICGPVGSGKSTLLTILSGLQPIQSNGRIQINGLDLGSFSRSQLTKIFTVVPQRAFLFAGTFRYNLNLNQNFSDEQLWQTLEQVCLATDIRAMPEGLDTWIGEWGITLSGGQKQRLALARTLLRKTPIMLFDDCLSAIDSSTEALILGNLEKITRTTTMIWVAHRPSTLRLCDRLFWLDMGQLSVFDIDQYAHKHLEDPIQAQLAKRSPENEDAPAECNSELHP